jgi:hypothetical protein
MFLLVLVLCGISFLLTRNVSILFIVFISGICSIIPKNENKLYFGIFSSLISLLYLLIHYFIIHSSKLASCIISCFLLILVLIVVKLKKDKTKSIRMFVDKDGKIVSVIDIKKS